MTIDAKSTPKYLQVKALLLEHIEEGEFDNNPGGLSDYELMKRYNTSRSTVRRALDELVRDGIVFREQGRGTFVKKRTHRLSTNICILIHDIPGFLESPFTREVLSGISEVFRQESVPFSLCDTPSFKIPDELAEGMYQSAKDNGLILLSSYPQAEVNKFRDKGFRPVSVNMDFLHYGITSIMPNEEEAFNNLMEILHTKGVSKFLFFNSTHRNRSDDKIEISALTREVRAFRAANRLDVKMEVIPVTDPQLEILSRLETQENDFHHDTAVIGSSEPILTAIADVFRNRNSSPKGEPIVAGFCSMAADKSLTSMRVDQTEMGRLAATAMLEELSNQDAGPRRLGMDLVYNPGTLSTE